MRRLNARYGQLLDFVAAGGALLIFSMMMLITLDVALRAFGRGGMGWVSEASEYVLYLSTFMAAPWLLRLGRHVRLDIALRALPAQVGWLVEWFTDLVGVVVCATLAVAGARILLASKAGGNLVIKTLEFPEWILLVPVPITFVLLAVEFLFRMYRLRLAPGVLRDDATSVA
jgi:TRAP-type C4-dicarboxylate transport system permease small subunit